jgi:hypothetical protein
LGKEDEGGEAVLGASSERVGVARNGGERRRPWRRLGYWEEFSGGREQEEKEERGK